MNSQPDYTREFAAIDNALMNIGLKGQIETEHIMRMVRDSVTLEDRIEPENVGDMIRNGVPVILPTVGAIDGSESGLFYRSTVNMLYGPDGSGKTLLMQRIALQEMERGNNVLWLEFEEANARHMVRRLIELGASADMIDEHFTMFVIKRPVTQDNRDMFATIGERCSLCVIDSCGEVMSIYGKDENRDAEVLQTLFVGLTRPIAAKGPAVVLVDHVTKTSDGKTPKGSARKRAAVDGVALSIAVDDGLEWSRHENGEARITCFKDRLGEYRRNQVVCYMTVWPTDNQLTIAIATEGKFTIDEMIDDQPQQSAVVVESADIEMEIIEILWSFEAPAHDRLIIDQLNQRGYSYTRNKFEKQIRKMAERGLVTLDRSSKPSKGWMPALRSVHETRKE